MHIRSVYLHHFRNYDEASFEFSPRLNLVCGPNAQGKTSLLESLYFLMTGRSFRSSSHVDMIQQGASNLYVECVFIKHEVEQKLKFFCGNKERKILYNSTAFSSSSSLLGLMPGVVMTPDDIALIKAVPQIRRTFLDVQIAQIDPLYVHHLTRYHRGMRQRNHLLRAKQMLTIESWEREMAVSAADLTRQRALAVADLQNLAARIHNTLTDHKEAFHIEYKTGMEAVDNLEKMEHAHLLQWEKQRQREILFGYTLSGPHKDDLLFSINGKEVRAYASEGQQRGCAMTLRLAERERLRRLTDEPPLLIVDDIGISLDAIRRRRLLEEIVAHPGQIFLSTTDENFLEGYSEEKQVIALGRISSNLS